MKIIASDLALELILALAQRRDGARLSELSAATAAPLSSVQRATRLLLADGFVDVHGRRRPRYRLSAAQTPLSALTRLAFAVLPTERVMTVLARSNPAIEFAAVDRAGYITVASPTADPRDALAFEDARSGLAAVGREIDVLRFEHQDAVSGARRDPGLRARVDRARILKGTLARSFPGRRDPADRARPGRGHGRPLAALFPRMSRRALAAIARKHGLRRMRVFGSAARGDLGRASDVDVLVEPRAPSQLSLAGLTRLESDLEGIFERHVDLVTPGGLRDDVRQAVEREGMTIHG